MTAFLCAVAVVSAFVAWLSSGRRGALSAPRDRHDVVERARCRARERLPRPRRRIESVQMIRKAQLLGLPNRTCMGRPGSLATAESVSQLKLYCRTGVSPRAATRSEPDAVADLSRFRR